MCLRKRKGRLKVENKQKLDPLWKGPYEIEKIQGSNAVIQEVGTQMHQVHINRCTFRKSGCISGYWYPHSAFGTLLSANWVCVIFDRPAAGWRSGGALRGADLIVSTQWPASVLDIANFTVSILQCASENCVVATPGKSWSVWTRYVGHWQVYQCRRTNNFGRTSGQRLKLNIAT
jgi:hypothetical protein